MNQSFIDSLGCDLGNNYSNAYSLYYRFCGACSLIVTGEKIQTMFYSQQRSFFPSLSFSGCEIFNESTGSEGKLSRKGLCSILNFIFSLKCQMEPYGKKLRTCCQFCSLCCIAKT